MNRPSLPQNYTKDFGTLVEDFENISDWSVVSGSAEVDTVNVKNGTKSLKLTSAPGSNVSATKPISLDLSSSSKSFRCYVYIYDPSTVESVMFYFSSTTTFSKFFSCTLPTSGVGNLKKGWNLLQFGRNEFSNTGGEDWANIMVRMRVRVNAPASSGLTAVAAFDELRANVKSQGKVVITFDDGNVTAYNEGILYMASKGLAGTMYVISNWVDNKPGLTMTKSQLDDTYSKGWALGVHTADHLDVSLLPSASEVNYQLKSCQDWLKAQGYSKGVEHVAYPHGGFNDVVLKEMSNLNMKTGRTIMNAYQSAPLTDPYQLMIKNIVNTTSLSAAINRVDQAMDSGSTVIFLLHNLAANPTQDVEWKISDFQAWIDYIVERKVPVVTIDEWYEGLTNPRKKVR